MRKKVKNKTEEPDIAVWERDVSVRRKKIGILPTDDFGLALPIRQGIENCSASVTFDRTFRCVPEGLC